MKKLLIKVICLTAFLIVLIGFFPACNNYSSSKTGDIKPSSTMGVINITATEESRVPSTIKPTLHPTEVPTEKPTVVFSSEEETVPPTQEVNNYVEDDYDYENMNFEPEEEYEDEDYYYDSKKKEESETDLTSSSIIYTPSNFQNMGVINWGGWTWTYYSEYILPGEGLYLPGRHVDNDGYICDGNGYICIASSSLPWGTIVDTPFGKQGKVYDSGCAGYILDVYVSW